MSECKSVTLPLRAVTAKLRLAAVRNYYRQPPNNTGRFVSRDVA